MEIYNFLVYTLAYIGFFAASYYAISLITFYRKKDLDRLSDDFKVSIIIPAYNEEKSIERTIQSALSLHYPKNRLEIIVVDDGSKDKTFSLAKKFSSKVVKVYSKKNGGKGSALNYGIDRAMGEIIVSMDADSFVQEDALKRMVVFFENPKVMAVTPSMGVYKPKGFLQRIQHIEYYMGVFLRKSFATVNAIHITPGAFSAYRKSFFQKYGGYDEHNITEDLEMGLRIQSKGYHTENCPEAPAYTNAPRTFRELTLQRRRWYFGQVRNLWSYRRIISSKYGDLGAFVIPTAILSTIFSVTITIYLFFKILFTVKDNLLF